MRRIRTKSGTLVATTSMIPDDVYDAVSGMAEQAGRSIGSEIELAVERHMAYPLAGPVGPTDKKTRMRHYRMNNHVIEKFKQWCNVRGGTVGWEICAALERHAKYPPPDQIPPLPDEGKPGR